MKQNGTDVAGVVLLREGEAYRGTVEKSRVARGEGKSVDACTASGRCDKLKREVRRRAYEVSPAQLEAGVTKSPFQY